MSNDLFDVSELSEAAVNESNSTYIIPCPEGEFPAVIKKFDIRAWSKEDRSGVMRSGVMLDVHLDIDDANAREVTQRDEVIVRHSCSLDVIKGPNGKPMIDTKPGTNVDLGRLRAAANLNNPGQPFNLNMLIGQPVKVLVTHRQNPDNPEEIYAEVKRGKVKSINS